jgi:excisionase family DNA binding protein
MTEERLLGPEEIAARLGISPLTVVRWLYQGKLRGRKLGRKHWRMRASDLEAFINQEPTPPAGMPAPEPELDLGLEWKPGEPRPPFPPFPIVDAVEER